MSMMVSFVLSFFPRDVLDEILNLIESVSEDFPSYFGNPVDQNIHSCYYIFWPGDISRKEQETQNLPSAHLSNFYR